MPAGEAPACPANKKTPRPKGGGLPRYHLSFPTRGRADNTLRSSDAPSLGSTSAHARDRNGVSAAVTGLTRRSLPCSASRLAGDLRPGLCPGDLPAQDPLLCGRTGATPPVRRLCTFGFELIIRHARGGVKSARWQRIAPPPGARRPSGRAAGPRRSRPGWPRPVRRPSARLPRSY